MNNENDDVSGDDENVDVSDWCICVLIWLIFRINACDLMDLIMEIYLYNLIFVMGFELERRDWDY